MSVVKEFKEFILRGNVVDLAVGVVIGASFSAVVAALVKDLITPFLAAIGGQPDFSHLYFTINGSKFLYGDFLNALIAFAIMATVIFFFVVKPVNHLTEKFARKNDEPTTKACVYCLSKIPYKARRCRYCASEQDIEEAAKS